MPHVEYQGWPSASKLKDLFPKPSIDLWVEKVGQKKAGEILEASQEHGNKVHELIEGYLRGEDRSMEEGTFEHKVLESVNRFLNDNNLKPLWIEKHLKSTVYKIHGTPDLICITGSGDLVVVDWKTGSLLDGLACVQLMVYAYLAHINAEYSHQKCRIGYFAKIDKEGNLKAILIQGLDKWHWLVEMLAEKWWRDNGDETSASLS